MCGIAGKLSPDNPASEELLARMCAAVRHRGPDSTGQFREGQAALGIQRLAVIDLETGDQPVFNEDESVVVVLNGEIYNYKELRAELERGGHRFRSSGDTEVIVHLYEDHGDRCVERLRGMFAFALWDRRRQRLLLARDRVGKKPLFYAERGGGLWFASEPKSMLVDPALPRDPDPGAIDLFLHYGYVPDPHSAFSALSKLPPAHTLTWENGRVRTECYWKLSYEPKTQLADTELEELVREQLLEATRLRLRSDVPLGAFLSGGIDSSGVVAAMAQVASGRIKTFTIGFAEDEFDERRYAREIAQRFDTDHHELALEPDAVALLGDLVWHYGEPFYDHSAIPSFYLSELTRRSITVALNGDGGDESFAGYNRYAGMLAAQRLSVLPKTLARPLARALARLGSGSSQASLRARAERLLNGAALPLQAAYSDWMAVIGTTGRRSLYEPAYAAQLDLDAAGAVIADPWRASDATATLDRLLDVDVQTYLPGDLLVKMDIASMAHSLEVRSPLLDHELMETVARFPASAKLEGRNHKRLLKRALSAWIPAEFFERPKRGFMVPLRDWLRGSLRELPGEVLLDQRSLQRGMFRESELKRLISDHHSGRSDNSDRLWSLIFLEMWFQTYVDRPPTGPIGAASLASA